MPTGTRQKKTRSKTGTTKTPSMTPGVLSWVGVRSRFLQIVYMHVSKLGFKLDTLPINLKKVIA